MCPTDDREAPTASASRGGADFYLAPLAMEHLDQVLVIETAAFSSPWTRGQFQREFEVPVSRMRGAFEAPERRLIGYLVAWLLPGETHILNLAVAPDRRRRGIGRALIEDLLRAAGPGPVWLEVRPSNRAARALYEGLGFGPAGLRRGYYDDSGEDALILCKT